MNNRKWTNSDDEAMDDEQLANDNDKADRQKTMKRRTEYSMDEIDMMSRMDEV